jgi:hypothetical protein
VHLIYFVPWWTTKQVTIRTKYRLTFLRAFVCVHISWHWASQSPQRCQISYLFSSNFLLCDQSNEKFHDFPASHSHPVQLMQQETIEMKWKYIQIQFFSHCIISYCALYFILKYKPYLFSLFHPTSQSISMTPFSTSHLLSPRSCSWRLLAHDLEK